MITVPAVLAIVGGIAFLVGLFGGGIEVRELKFPAISRLLRILSTLSGAMLIGFAAWLSSADLVPPTPPPTPIISSTAIDTPTPTVTASPTNTPTPTASPTNTPTVTTAPLSDLSDAVLTLQDFPSGFEEIPPATFGFTKEDLSQEGFTVESLFAFLEAEHFEFVVGFTTLLPTGLEQAGFDVALRQPDFLLESLIVGMGPVDILEQKELPGLDDIGDASVGLTVVIDVEGFPMRVDVVAFRRDIAGAFVIIMYLDGEVPIVPIGDVARKFDERVVGVLSPHS